MTNKVVQVAPLADGRLHVTLEDGRTGEFDAKPFMQSDFFSALKSAEYFNQVGLFFSGVGWPGGQDLGPDTIEAFLSVTESVSA
ncbi:MAG: DUF2442 domain-containing protein [Hydrogenophaga sp.]|uniref:DUF2442 domain-containing protein n=1 Tax=Hydrogenophaga sp. TaxID=1904254 RepID=UPI002ABC8B3C|nr:DUF2442 domain-containing protein [Hydrogenophaga sp.]MDZ4190361.1 DUF2442 domain-containing protein [Hydrogenophaga sp.]